VKFAPCPGPTSAETFRPPLHPTGQYHRLPEAAKGASRRYRVDGASLGRDHAEGSALSLCTAINMPTEEERCDPPDLPSQVNGHKSGGSDKILLPGAIPPTPTSIRPAMDG
jgi:hypothetical protein